MQINGLVKLNNTYFNEGKKFFGKRLRFFRKPRKIVDITHIQNHEESYQLITISNFGQVHEKFLTFIKD